MFDDDTMQICLNGHVVTDRIHKYFDFKFSKNFCDGCGEKTITNCPKCDKPIPYTSHGKWTFINELSSVPAFCPSCSEAFPWTLKEKAKCLEAEAEKPIEALQRVFSKFHSIARRLRNRYNDRETLYVNDEYDVQNLLSALLILYFDDIRTEEWTPSYAGKSAKMDFLLKKNKIVVEVKMTREKLADKEIGDQLIIDIERYKEHPDCNTLICFIYDPNGKIANSHALIGDLQNQSRDDLKVIVLVYPLS